MVTWGGGGENSYPDVTVAAQALGCSPEWLGRGLQAAFLNTVAVPELDLYRDSAGGWIHGNLERMFQVGERVSLFGEITKVHSETGDVTVLLHGVSDPVKVDPASIVSLERGANEE